MSESFSKEDVKKVAKGAGTTLIGSSIGKGLFFLSQVIVARFLGVEAFGLYALGFAAVKICEILSRLGLNMGGMRFVSIYKDTNAHKLKGILISALGLALLNGVFVGMLLYFLSDIVARKIFHQPTLTEILKLFALSIPFVSGLTMVSYLLQGFHTTKYTVYSRDFIQPGTNILLILFFYRIGFGLSGVIYAFTISNFLAFVASFLFFKKLFPKFLNRDLKPDYEIKKLLSYSAPLLFVGFLHYFLTWTDTLMIGLLSSARDIGIYRAASQVPFIMTLFLTAASSIFAPLVADLYQKREMQRLSNIFKSTTRWVTYLIVPIFIFLVFSSKEIMMLFGKEYIETGSIVLIILSFGQLVNCVTGGVGYTIVMTGRQNLELANSIGLVFLNVILNLLLIPRYGAVGAAISAGSSIVLINLLRVIETYFIYNMIPFSQKMMKVLVPTFLCVLVLLIGQNNLSGIGGAFSSIFLILVIFGISIYVLKLADEDKYILDIFRNKLLCKISK